LLDQYAEQLNLDKQVVHLGFEDPKDLQGRKEREAARQKEKS